MTTAADGAIRRGAEAGFALGRALREVLGEAWPIGVQAAIAALRYVLEAEADGIVGGVSAASDEDAGEGGA